MKYKFILLLTIVAAGLQSFAQTEVTSERYYFKTTLSSSFDESTKLVKEALKTEGFGVITEVQMHEKLKEKLDVDIKKYLLLGVCNPKLAYSAIQVEENIGLFLPCKVLVKEIDENHTEIVAINPSETMNSLGNAKLDPISKEVTDKLLIALKKL